MHEVIVEPPIMIPLSCIRATAICWACILTHDNVDGLFFIYRIRAARGSNVLSSILLSSNMLSSILLSSIL